MTMTRVRSHPGRLLRAELDARQLSAHQLALSLRVPPNRITAILKGERSVTAETALRLGRFLGTGPAFWMNLQAAYDVSVAEAELGKLIEAEVPTPSGRPTR
jgi:addiction module HigA family antidote